jgi:hypothetical protein
MAAKRKNIPKISKAAKQQTEDRKEHWFPEQAKAPTAATTPAKKSPWQRRPAVVNYGTLARPGIDFKQLMNAHLDSKYPKFSDTQRRALWSVVATKMLTEPSDRLIAVIDREAKALQSSK